MYANGQSQPTVRGGGFPAILRLRRRIADDGRVVAHKYGEHAYFSGRSTVIAQSELSLEAARRPELRHAARAATLRRSGARPRESCGVPFCRRTLFPLNRR
jgi:hypothetical protein